VVETPQVQHLLNCGGVGSCKGGTVDGPYQRLGFALRSVGFLQGNHPTMWGEKLCLLVYKAYKKL